MPRQYPPHFRREMIDRMLEGEPVLALVLETSVPEQTLHRWKHQALIDAGLLQGVEWAAQGCVGITPWLSLSSPH